MNINTTEAILRILLSFMLIDNKIDDKEKVVILNFLKSKFGSNFDLKTFSFAKYKGNLNFENFSIDAKNIYNDNNVSEWDRLDILKLISDLIKADWSIHDKEVMLFEILLENWKIPKSKMTELWIQKSLWSRFFWN